MSPLFFIRSYELFVHTYVVADAGFPKGGGGILLFGHFFPKLHENVCVCVRSDGWHVHDLLCLGFGRFATENTALRGVH